MEQAAPSLLSLAGMNPKLEKVQCIVREHAGHGTSDSSLNLKHWTY